MGYCQDRCGCSRTRLLPHQAAAACFPGLMYNGIKLVIRSAVPFNPRLPAAEAGKMPKSRRAKKANISICYDFDGTLIRGNMQENSFLPEVGKDPSEFWAQVGRHAKKHDMDEVLAYMHLMIEAARSADQPFNREALRDHGKRLDLFPGVATWFGRINEYCREAGATVEHFVISSGLKEMIKGSEIAGEFKHVFASGFSYDANGVPVFAARSVNYTTKTQYLFRINKGILSSWDNEKINRYTPEEDRSRPFSRMIYIGDGETDVPAMKMVNHQGGYSIVVWPSKKGARITPAEKKKKEAAEQLVKDNRAQFVAEADYEDDGPVHRIVTMLIRRIVDEYDLRMNLKAG